MYRESVFTNLSDDKKLDLLQETVNRDAEERGMVGAPQVTFSDLPSNVSGQASDGVIEVNREMVLNGTQTYTRDGKTMTNNVLDNNCQALNTVIHENIHCWQDQITDGTITIDDAEKAAQYQANCFTTSAVLQDGSYKMGSQYLTGKTSHHCYFFQSTERDAHKGAEEKTNSIIQSLTEKFGTEKSFQEYEKNMQANGYQAMEKEAADIYKNPNFEKDLNQTLMNQYYGTKTQVHPGTENVVKTEMIASYKDLNAQVTNTNSNTNSNTNTGGKNMSLQGPVTLENYNESLENKGEETTTELSNEETNENETTKEDNLDAEDDLDDSEDVDSGDDLDGGDDDLDV